MRTIIFIMAMLCCTVVFGQKQERYSRAKVYLDSKHTIRDLSQLGVAVDHGEHKKGTFLITDYSASEIKAIKKAGFKVDVLIKDVTKHYQQQNKKNKNAAGKTTTTTDCNPGPALDAPAHFALGSYAGYYTYTELLNILDTMQALYPGLISSKAAIDTYHTIEGRPIYWVRMSNNPSVDQPAKPQMLYTALHHAREPGSITSTIYYMWYMLEHYATDPHIKALIDNTELYFIPCINPDGYLYNISTNPGGGGMWRKNRRNNGGGTYGVDLNRNYGYEFAYDNIGSSPTASSDVYRGPSGFSEPETRAVKWFTQQHHFKAVLNYHTFGNDIIYPWGYIGSLQTPDSAKFQSIAAYVTQYTPYRYGTGDQTVGYVTNGDSDDWMYGDTAGGKVKSFAMTPETGVTAEGFYAPSTSIVPNAKNNLRTNIGMANLLLPFATIATSDQKIITQPGGYFHYDLQRLGYPDTATFTVTVTPLDSWLTLPSTPHTYTSLAMLQKVSDSVSYTLSAATPNGQLVRYELALYNGYYYTRDTIEFYYGKTSRNFVPNTNTLTDWTNGGWSLCTTTYHSAPASINSDNTSCNNYSDNTIATISTTAAADLTHATHAYLYFYCKWGIESTYDYAVALAAPAGTTAWQPLCGRYTKPGSTYQIPNDPIYDGQHQDWVQEEIDLSDYLGQKINIGFEMDADAAVNYSGFYIDDMNVIAVIDSSFVGVQEVVAQNGALHVYPNPAKDFLNIQSEGTAVQPVKVLLFDCTGREAASAELERDKGTMGVQSLAPGIYYLKAEGYPVQKVVLQR